MLRATLRALCPFALLVPAHAADRALGLLLHTGLHLEGVWPQVVGLLDGGSMLRGTFAAIACGALLWLGLALERSHRESLGGAEALRAEASTFDLLYLLPIASGLGLLSVASHPDFPYASTLAVALTQDLYPALLLFIAGGILAARVPHFSLPAPETGEVFFIAFLAYALLSPEWARHWEGHPGNEPKTLRMALAIGSRLTLNVEPETSLEPDTDVLGASSIQAFGPSVREATKTLLAESYGMVVALANGREAFGAQAIRAERLARQTVRGKDGGVYHVLAPGPSALLAPFLQLDRLLDSANGTPGRLALTLLFWNALAAGLVASLYRLARYLTGQGGLCALLVLALGLLPPLLLFAFQFYPEVLGALVLTLVSHSLLDRRPWQSLDLFLLGATLAVLPWLHQKFLPVWGVLVLLALHRAVDDLVTFRSLLLLLLPQAVSAYAIALLNFAITGSVRPDALFLAWGPGGVSGSHLVDGLFGLLFDFRYGLLPVVPVYFLAAAGLLQGGRRLLLIAPPFLVYYVTVAAADNWSGSVCNLGRYVMPAVPVLILGVALLLATLGQRRGAIALCLTLFAGTGALTGMLFADPQAANDSARLFASSAYADFNLYVPNLFFRSWNYAGPGQTVRLAFLIVLGAVLTFLLLERRTLRRAPSTVCGTLALLLATSFFLERWPPTRRAPFYANAVKVSRAATVYLGGDFSIRDERLFVRSGRLDLLVSSGGSLEDLQAVATGGGRVGEGGAPLERVVTGATFRIPLHPLARVKGIGNTEESLLRQTIEVETPGEIELQLRAGRPSSVP